jgi:hypothetical protein
VAAADVGMDGNGFTVAVERALSVLELVTELKRELGSFLVMVTGRSNQLSCCFCCSSTGRCVCRPLSVGSSSDSGHLPVEVCVCSRVFDGWNKRCGAEVWTISGGDRDLMAR